MVYYTHHNTNQLQRKVLCQWRKQPWLLFAEEEYQRRQWGLAMWSRTGRHVPFIKTEKLPISSVYFHEWLTRHCDFDKCRGQWNCMGSDLLQIVSQCSSCTKRTLCSTVLHTSGKGTKLINTYVLTFTGFNVCKFPQVDQRQLAAKFRLWNFRRKTLASILLASNKEQH